MRKVYYNSWFARHLLMPGYTTITIAAVVLTKFGEGLLPQRIKNHESTHIRQWGECCMVCGFLIWLLLLIFGISPWWMLLSVVAFYILYVLEWLVKIPKYGKHAYRNISFEREARAHELDNNYLENSGYFGWIKLF